MRVPSLLLTVVVAASLGGCRRKAQPADAAPDAAAPPVDRPPAAEPTAAPCARVPGSFAELARRLAPSLVTIVGQEERGGPGPFAALPLLPSGALPAPAPGEGADEQAPLGSGFVVDGERLVVTSIRVVGDAPSLGARLHDGELTTATLRGVDPDLDLAILSLDRPARGALAYADAGRARAGDWVAVLSSPFGGETTTSAGIIRVAEVRSPDSPPLVAIDAVVDAASWGGAVVDTSGRLVGMAMAAVAPPGRTSLVLPAAELRRAAASILERGQVPRAWIGLWVRPVEPAEAEESGLSPPQGLIVTRTVAGGPADVAGVRPGDVILEFSGEPAISPGRLGTLASRTPPDQDIPVVIFRDGRSTTARIRPAAMPQ